MNNNLILGISGNRQAGKDTLFTCLQKIDSRFYHYAFANQLKDDTASLVANHMGYDPYNLTPEQKEIVRPLWIGYGMAQRARDPLHWVKVVANDIIQIQTVAGKWDCKPEICPIPVVVDFRFENEVKYFRETFGDSFKLINVERNPAPPPTEEEMKHCEAVKAMSDYRVVWGNDTEEQRDDIARHIWVWLKNEGKVT